MLKQLFGSLFGNNANHPSSKPSAQYDTYTYNGYRITPMPQKRDGGYSTEAMIEKEVNGETKQHHFIRSDTAGSADQALELIESKVKLCLDQQADGVFR